LQHDWRGAANCRDHVSAPRYFEPRPRRTAHRAKTLFEDTFDLIFAAMAPHDEQTSVADSSVPSAPLPRIGLRAPITAFDAEAPDKVALVRQVGEARTTYLGTVGQLTKSGRDGGVRRAASKPTKKA
jgi:hypothetical protein